MVVIVVCLQQPIRGTVEDLHCSRVDATTATRARGRSESFVGPMRSKPCAVEKRIDTSPYCVSYLSPPAADLGWRRTNSDSALHRSVQNLSNNLHGHSPGSQRRGTWYLMLPEIRKSGLTRVRTPGIGFQRPGTNAAVGEFS